jgi:putative hemolysin
MRRIKPAFRPLGLAIGLAVVASAGCASTDGFSETDRQLSAQERDCRERGGQYMPNWQSRQASRSYICVLDGGDRHPPANPAFEHGRGG